MLLLNLIFALLIITLAGRFLLLFINKREKPDTGLLLLLSLSFMLGLGLVSLQMFFYSLVGLTFSFFAISVPWIVVSVIYCFKGKRSFSFSLSGEGTKCGCLDSFKGLGLLGWLSLLVVGSQVLFAFFSALLMPISGWDAWSIWFMKARVFFLEGRVASEFLLDKTYAFAHMDYPLLLPLATSWLYTCMGVANDQLAKVIFPIQFLVMLVIFFNIVKRLSTRENAIVFTIILSLSSVIMTHAGGFPMPFGTLDRGDFVGYADLTLSIYFLCGAAFFYLYMIKDDAGSLFFAVIFFAMGAWTKNEGLPYALLGIILIASYLFIFSREKRPGSTFIVLLALSFLVVVAPWLLYKSYLSLHSEYSATLSFSTVFENIGRLSLILSRTGKFMFLNTDLFNLTWYLYFLTTILNWRGLLRAPLALLNLFFPLQFSLYVFIYIISPSEIQWHLDTSLDRLILHMVPLVIFITAINFHMLLGRLRSDIKV